MSLDGHERGAVLPDPVLAALGVSGPVYTVELERIETLVDRGKAGYSEMILPRLFPNQRTVLKSVSLETKRR